MDLKIWKDSSRRAARFLLVPAALAACVIAAVLQTAGCASPPDVKYHDIKLAAPEAAAGSPLGSLHLEQVSVPAHLDQAEIFYRTSAYDAGYYDYHLWVRPLSESLAFELLEYLRATGRFGTLAGPDERSPGAWSMRLKVLEFAENDSGGAVWTADVELLVRLREPATGRSRETRLARRIPLNARNAAGTVEALNRALSELSGEILAAIESFARQ